MVDQTLTFYPPFLSLFFRIASQVCAFPFSPFWEIVWCWVRVVLSLTSIYGRTGALHRWFLRCFRLWHNLRKSKILTRTRKHFLVLKFSDISTCLLTKPKVASLFFWSFSSFYLLFTHYRKKYSLVSVRRISLYSRIYLSWSYKKPSTKELICKPVGLWALTQGQAF